MTSENVVLLERLDSHVARLRIHRPEARNALNGAVRESLAMHFEALGRDPEVRVIVLTGGENFAAGADLRDLAQRGTLEMHLRASHLLWQSIAECPKPVVAAVAGYAWGGGCELAMHADIIIAGEGASFAQPEIKVGIMPGAGGTQRLVRAVGKARAMRMLLTGEPVGAAEALAMGLVSEVVPDAELQDRAVALAQKIARMPPIAVGLIKEAVLAGMDAPLAVGLALERKSFQILFDSEDQKEGMRAFLDKRKPEFQGR
jgi:enoyl-CoA hydratase